MCASIIFLLPRFPLPRFPVLVFGAEISTPAFPPLHYGTTFSTLVFFANSEFSVPVDASDVELIIIIIVTVIIVLTLTDAEPKVCDKDDD